MRAAVLKQESNLEDDLHLSSLERVELLSALEDRYQVDLSETSFSAARTVGDLRANAGGKGAERVDVPLSALDPDLAGALGAERWCTTR